MIDVAIESRLVAQLRSRDSRSREAALAQLFDLLGRPLLQLCLRVTCDPTDAEDAVQETFVDVLRGIDGFRSDARLSTWVFRVAIRAALRIRTRRATRREQAPVERDDDEAPHAREIEGAGPDPSAIAQERESTAKILAAIERLPLAQRTVLGLAALDEMPQTEVAEILGVPVGTVYSRLSAAREQLRVELAR